MGPNSKKKSLDGGEIWRFTTGIPIQKPSLFWTGIFPSIDSAGAWSIYNSEAGYKMSGKHFGSLNYVINPRWGRQRPFPQSGEHSLGLSCFESASTYSGWHFDKRPKCAWNSSQARWSKSSLGKMPDWVSREIEVQRAKVFHHSASGTGQQ